MTRPAVLLEADVLALVDAWVAAQNAGDFAAYERLYAAKLEGVKRARGRTWRFDRAGWMTDRARMFAHPMTVTASDVDVQITAGTAVVELTQTFAQGAFQDAGTKRIVVVVEAGSARIAREEMLQSRSADPIGAASGVFIVADRSTLLIQQDAPTTWGGGTKSISDGEVMSATQPIGNAPAEVKAWRGRKVALYAADGTRCDATVDSLYLDAGVIPHILTRKEWDGSFGPVYTDEQIATEILGPSAHLMGNLALDGSCAAVVAIEAATPAFFAPVPDPAVEARAIAAFRKLPEYKAIQKDFRSYGERGPWAPEPHAQVFGTAPGTRYVAVSAAEGEGCGSFEGELWGMWSVSPAGALSQIDINLYDAATAWSPLAVFDATGDGSIELIATPTRGEGRGDHEALFELTGGELTRTHWVSYPYNDCSC